MNRALGIIPARWNSTRFQGKPLYLIAGKPLLRRAWERAMQARKLDSVIIATDDMRIGEAAFDWGAEVALTSPNQGDEPLVDPRLIDKVVEKLRSDRKIEIVTAAHPFANASEACSPHQNKVVIDCDSNALYFSRAVIPYPGGRSADVNYLRHQGIYGFRRGTLLQFVKWKPTPLERAESLEQLRALENGVKIHVLVTAKGSPGVDTLQDADALEQTLVRAKRRAVS
jgi:3-deoxy-manno-octulosonate cytidylyltransferase (CMP-KDO synthetase)